MLYKKSRVGLIEPDNDFQYQAILATREKEKMEKKMLSMEEEIKKIKEAVGIR